MAYVRELVSVRARYYDAQERCVHWDYEDNLADMCGRRCCDELGAATIAYRKAIKKARRQG